MFEPTAQTLWMIFMGVLGGVTRALLKAKKLAELKRYEIMRDIVLGAIGGVVYVNMILEWGLPDSVVTFFFSYSFADIVDNLSKRVIKRIEAV